MSTSGLGPYALLQVRFHGSLQIYERERGGGGDRGGGRGGGGGGILVEVLSLQDCCLIDSIF